MSREEAIKWAKEQKQSWHEAFELTKAQEEMEQKVITHNSPQWSRPYWCDEVCVCAECKKAIECAEKYNNAKKNISEGNMRFYRFEKSNYKLTVNLDDVQYIHLCNNEVNASCSGTYPICRIDVHFKNGNIAHAYYDKKIDRETDYNLLLTVANKEILE